MIDWRDLKAGDTIWYINTHGPDYDAPHPRGCLELWKGTVKGIDPGAVHPVDCTWDRIGGGANWIKPEWGWYRAWVISENRVEPHNKNNDVFFTAEEAINEYLKSPREKLLKQAAKLNSNQEN